MLNSQMLIVLHLVPWMKIHHELEEAKVGLPFYGKTILMVESRKLSVIQKDCVQ